MSDLHPTSSQSSNPPPGWYLDRAGAQRWFDGVNWTEHVQAPPAPMTGAHPTTAAAPAPVFGQMTHGGLTNGQHLLHLVLTVFTGGLWGFVWAFKAWGARTRSSVRFR